MAREWQPGDVVWIPGVGRAMATGNRDEVLIGRCDHQKRHADTFVNVRPLVVIDPEDREQAARLIALFSDQFTAWSTDGERDADKMQAALREFANPKPPKPEEPTGLGAVVEDAAGLLWVRVEPHDPRNAIAVHAWRNRVVNAVPRENSWLHVDAVRVLSEGVTP